MSNIHDRWFKRVLKQRRYATALLQVLLPKELVERLDFRTLRACDTHSIDKILSERENDLLFQVKFRHQLTFILILWEHHSKVDPWMLFRLLQAMVRIWEEYRASNPNAKTLPLIIPIVLHHSKRGWTGPTSFEELYDIEPEVLEVLRRYVPCFTMLLDDISQMTEDQLRAHVYNAYVRLALRLLQKVRLAPNAKVLMNDLTSFIEDVLDKPHGSDFLMEVLQYLLQANDRLDEHELTKHLAKMSEKSQDTWQELVMTAAKRLRQEGYKEGYSAAKRLQQEGREEGLVAGKRSLLLKQLKLRFRKVPKAVVEQVQQATVDELDMWAERILTAQSLEELIGS